jgi:hypothetical protein
MRRDFALLTLALTAFAGLSLVNPALAGPTVPHKEKASGVIHVSEVLPNSTIAVQEWTAVGRATHMGKYTQVGSHKANLATGEIFDGVFVSTAADGSTVFGTFSGTFTINGDGSVSYSVTAIWLGGTGRLAGITGIAEVQALATGAAPGSTFVYVTEGTWTRP